MMPNAGPHFVNIFRGEIARIGSGSPAASVIPEHITGGHPTDAVHGHPADAVGEDPTGLHIEDVAGSAFSYFSRFPEKWRV